MKHKFSKILGVGLTLALLASMLVMATPVVAVEAPTYGDYTLTPSGTGTADWSTEEARSGKYSVKLYAPGAGDHWGDYGLVVMPLDMEFEDLADFSAWVEGGTPAQALPLLDINLAIDETATSVDLSADNGNNPGPTDVDLSGARVLLGSQPGQSEGKSPTLMSDDIEGWEKYGTHSDATINVGGSDDACSYWSMFVWNAGGSYNGTYDYYTWDEIHDAFDGIATVEYVRVDLIYPQDPEDVASTVYVDDIEINGVTYDLEPIALDAEGYSVVDTVGVTVCNGNANSDPVRIDEVEVSATSSSDAIGLTLTLEETGVNTGVFAVSFPTTGTTPPAVGELLVSDGDTITASYTGNWGVGEGEVEVTATAPVDETAPVFTSVTGEDFYKNTDTITLTATLDMADYTVTADFSAIDSEYTEDEEVTDGGDDTYTITYDISEDNTMADGEYIIPVTAEDIAGNSTTDTSFSTTLDNTEPAVTDPTATPAVIQPATETDVTFTAIVSDGEGSSVDTVIVDLSSIDGSATQEMAEADPTEAPGVYTCILEDVLVAEADYPLPITATDALGNVNDAEAITLRVLLDITPPVIVSTDVEYPVGAVSARAGDSEATPPVIGDPVVITAVVTDDLAGVDEVKVDATKIGAGAAEAMSLVEGTTDTYSATLTVGSVDPGTYTLPITATDLAANDALEASVDVEVVISLTGYNIALYEGWNLISLPLIPDVAAIETVLTGVTVDIVWAYDASIEDPVERWSSYAPGAPGDLDTMNAGKGYWVEMSAPAVITIVGKELPDPPATPPTYGVVEGWNLIGFKSVQNRLAHHYLRAIISDVVMIYGYDAEDTIYVVVNPAPADVGGGNFEVGHGYWIAVTEAGTIYP